MTLEGEVVGQGRELVVETGFLTLTVNIIFLFLPQLHLHPFHFLKHHCPFLVKPLHLLSEQIGVEIVYLIQILFGLT